MMISKTKRGRGHTRNLEIDKPNIGTRKAANGKLGLSIGALALVLLPNLAMAMSAGKITVQSFLNEPFRATIPLTSLQTGELDRLRVSLADDAAYASLGLEKSVFMTGLQFNASAGNTADSAIVSITSRRAAQEPFFSILLEFRGNSGRLVREYTVLLDPNNAQSRSRNAASTAPVVAATPTAPAFKATPAKPAVARQTAPIAAPAPEVSTPAPQQPAVVAQPRRQGAPISPFEGGDKERQVAVPSPETFRGDKANIQVPPSVPAQSIAPAYSGAQYGPVKAGLTLWQIAAAVRPNSSLTMNQVMWGLYSSNESKFDGNLNLVLQGAVLNVPSAQAMRDVSPAEAAALVADQATQHKQRLQNIRAAASPSPQRVAVESVAVQRPAPQPVAPVSEPAARPVATPQRVVEPESPAVAVRSQVDDEFGQLEDLPTAQSDMDKLESLPADRNQGSVQSGADVGQDFSSETNFEDLPALPVEDAADGAELNDDFGGADSNSDAFNPDLTSEGGDVDDEGLDQQSTLDDGSEESGSSLFTMILGALGVLFLALMVVLGLRRRGSAADSGPVSDFSTPRSAPSSATPRAQASGAATSAAAAASAVSNATADDTADFGIGKVEAEQEIEIPDLDGFAAADTQQQDSDGFEETAIFDEPPAMDGDIGTVEFGDTEVRQLAPTELIPTVDAGPQELDMPDLEMDIDGGTQTLDMGSETVSLELNEDPVSEADFQLAYGLYDEAALLLNRALESEPDRIELHEKLAETYFAASDAENFKQAAQVLQSKQPDAETWQRISIMGQQLCPEDALFSGSLDEATAGSLDLDMDFDGDAGSDAAGNDNLLEFDMDASTTSAADVATRSDDSNVLEFDLEEEPSPSDNNLLDFEPEPDSAVEPAPTSSASNLADDFDADFGSLTIDADDDSGDLADLDDLDLGEFGDLDDLEGDDAENSLLTDETSFDLEDPAGDSDSSTDDFNVTDFDLDDGVELSDDADLGVAQVNLDDLSERSSNSDFDLGELDAADSDDNSIEFTLDDDGPSTPGTDFELDDLGNDDSSSDFDLGELDSESTVADFDLDDISSDADGTDFNLDDLGASETGFDLDNPVGESADLTSDATDFDLDDIGSGTIDLDSGTADIAGGDEAATKLDLAKAYIDMGEADMARGLLDEVNASGSSAQQAEAQELLGQL